MITIPLKAKVNCSDGDFGQAMSIIINPAISQVTHMVVKKTELPQREIMVPVNWVLSTKPGSILLNHTWEELEKRETFIKDKFFKECDAGCLIPLLNSLSGNSTNRMLSVEYKTTAPLRIIMNSKTSIKAIDKHVGSLEDLVINLIDGTITHLILGRGRFLGKEEIIIPVSQVKRFETDTVYLKINEKMLNAFPSCKAWKHLLFGIQTSSLRKDANKNRETISQKVFYIDSLDKGLH
jgi:sporulation protein YlmC with PRC-barrel domain